MLATKPKPKTKAIDPVTAVADKFKIIEFGLDDAAKKWLRQRGVNTLELYLWLGQLDSEETSIEFREWAKRVDLAKKAYHAAGWMAVNAGARPQLSQAAFWSRIAAVDVGISFGCVGIDLHEIRIHDPEFRSAVSESGYRSHATGDSCPDPVILMRDIERMIGDERKKKKFPKGVTKAEVPAVIEVVSTPAEKLTTEEHRTLSHCEKTINRGATAFLDTGDALTVILEQRLYREQYSTFEAYLWEEFHLERSVAYRWIKAAATHTKTSAIAYKLNLSITNESQLRALETVIEPQDLQAVLKRAARKITPNADGLRVPTAKILAESVREEFTSPEDLRRWKEAKRQKPLAVELIDQADREETAAAESHGVAGDPSEFAKGFEITGPQTSEEIAEERYRWNGRQCLYAAELHDVRSSLEKLFFSRQGNGQFRDDLAALLTSLAVEIKTGKVRSLPAPAVARTLSLRRER